MKNVNISEIARQLVEMIAQRGTPITEIKKVTVSVELVDGTKITKKVDAFNYGVFIGEKV